MDEILLLERAKQYMEMLSKGIDPIGGKQVPDDSILSNERLKKCFDYVGTVLQRVLDNNGEVVSVHEKFPFYLPKDKIDKVEISDFAISSSEFVKRINMCVDLKTTKRFSGRPIIRWLQSNNYLTETEVSVKILKKISILNENSSAHGIDIRQKIVKSTGEVKEEIVFTKQGQQFILEHIDEIISCG